MPYAYLQQTRIIVVKNVSDLKSTFSLGRSSYFKLSPSHRAPWTPPAEQTPTQTCRRHRNTGNDWFKYNLEAYRLPHILFVSDPTAKMGSCVMRQSALCLLDAARRADLALPPKEWKSDCTSLYFREANGFTGYTQEPLLSSSFSVFLNTTRRAHLALPPKSNETLRPWIENNLWVFATGELVFTCCIHGKLPILKFSVYS